jgi:hypothetical protein
MPSLVVGFGEAVLRFGDFDNLDEFYAGAYPKALNPVQFTFLFGDF